MLPRLKLLLCAAALSLCATGSALAADAPSYGPQLQGFDYPFPLKQFSFTSQGAPLQMGYLDVSPVGRKNGQTVVLMHGKISVPPPGATPFRRWPGKAIV
ncbi:MAG: hypothetical protein ACFWUG_08090 [Rahnella inusitata]|jgi:hypothetical protein